MGWFWWLRNYREEGASWAERTAALRPGPEQLADTDPAFWAQADLQSLLLFLLQDQSRDRHDETPKQRALIERLLTAYRRPHPRSARFPGLLWPFTAFFLGGYDQILPLADGAVTTTRALGGSWELGISLMFRTHLALGLPGGLESAEADEPELVALARRVGDRWMLAQVAAATAEMRQIRGRYDEARTAYEEALALTCELGAYTEGRSSCPGWPNSTSPTVMWTAPSRRWCGRTSRPPSGAYRTRWPSTTRCTPASRCAGEARGGARGVRGGAYGRRAGDPAAPFHAGAGRVGGPDRGGSR